LITLGIDCGTSALKAMLVGGDETILATASRSYLPDRPHPLWSEQDPQVWIEAMRAALDELRRRSPREFEAVEALGFSGQMHGAVVLGADDEPLRPAMLHNDGRAHEEARELWEKHRDLAAIVGVKPMPGFTAPKYLWLTRREPEIAGKTACVMAPKDYLRFWLTGEKRTDMSDAAGTWWLDEAKRAWSRRALDVAGASEDLTPRLSEGCEVVGGLRSALRSETGLSAEVKIVAGGGDAAVGAVAIGAIKPQDAYVSLGTATQLIVASDVFRAAPETLVHSFAHAIPERWYRMAAMLNGAGALAFAARVFGASVETLEAEAASLKEEDADVLFLPYLSGERTPHDDPYARGVFFGLSEKTTRADCARAVMEGVALTLQLARACLESAGDAISRVGLIGGGARSAFWTRLIAASLQRDVVRYRGGEAGPAFGAARLARIGASGARPDDLCHAPEIADVTAPEPGLVEALRRKGERFNRLYGALKAEFRATAQPTV